MYKIAMCVETGEYHRIRNRVCQDATGKCVQNGCASVVLCDGAGSVEGSEKASEFVCSIFPEYLCKNFERLYEGSDVEITMEVIRWLREKSVEAIGGIKLDCTMLASCMSKDGRCLSLHIGDGIILGDAGDDFEVVSEAENGDASNITYFLSGKRAVDHLRITRKECTTFFLTSDGLSDLLCTGKKIMKAVPVMTSWLNKYSEEEVEAKYKKEMYELFSERTQDDMSVAVLTNIEDNEI